MKTSQLKPNQNVKPSDKGAKELKASNTVQNLANQDSTNADKQI